MNPCGHLLACNSCSIFLTEIERSQKENQKLIELLSTERDQFGKRETELMAEISEEKTKNKFLQQMALMEGVRRFAWWKDGIQYVGSTGKTLKKALEEIAQEKT